MAFFTKHRSFLLPHQGVIPITIPLQQGEQRHCQRIWRLLNAPIVAYLLLALPLFPLYAQPTDPFVTKETLCNCDRIIIQSQIDSSTTADAPTPQQLLLTLQRLEKQNKIYFWATVSLLFFTLLLTGSLLHLNYRHRPKNNSPLKEEQRVATEKIPENNEKHFLPYDTTQQNEQTLILELEKKRREIADYALLVENKNQLILLTINEIESHRTAFKVKNRKAMDSLLEKLRANIAIEEEWERFKLHFENLHPNFFSRLLLQAPNLTPDDLRFCAYLSLNISAKDIARLMNITPGAVRQRIYRIRKKLNLNTNAELMTLLMGI